MKLNKRITAKGGYGITGPGVSRNGYLTGPQALSAAINIAQREVPDDSTVYVRDQAGDIFGRVERDADSNLFVYRTGRDQ